MRGLQDFPEPAGLLVSAQSQLAMSQAQLITQVQTG
jgi:hypothetical protein